MVAEIAAMVDGDGCSGVLNEPGTVIVYRRSGGVWEIDRSMEVSLDRSNGLREMRRKMADILQFLNGCRIFAARAAGGALYFELEKAGCSVWEISGKPADFLDVVLDDEEKERIAAQSPGVAGIPAPHERAPGTFFISIREIQGKSPEISSKQILQQFIAEGNFSVLEIQCDHVPPWIEVEAEKRDYSIEAEKIGQNDLMVRLTRKKA
jgi:Fe-only nitrogenase accessory protein AnfO